jgi:hypothetical protein
VSHSVTVLHALETKTIADIFHASCVRMSSTTLASPTLGDATSLAPPVPVSGLPAAALTNAAATCVAPDSSVAPPSVTSPPPSQTLQLSGNFQLTAAGSDVLPEENTLGLLNVMVSSGRAAFLKVFLDTRKPPVEKLCLDGRNKGYDVALILQCFLLLRESNVCVSTSAFEACNYESSSFSDSSALAVLSNLPVDRTRIQTLKLQRFAVNDAVMEFCCKQFPSLTCLDVGNNETLRNVPAAIQLLSGLVSLNLSNCSNLASLPDELLKLRTTLRTISADGCDAITFPPKSICEKGKISIFNFMDNAQTAKPLRRVKVMFLGNGRSGKTSLLGALAKQPLQPGDDGPVSTKGVSVNTLDKELKPGFLESFFEQLPEITYWDFAGQLEYSAAHDFFISSRQAVYVIIFSVMDDRDSQMNQVACAAPLALFRLLLHVE